MQEDKIVKPISVSRAKQIIIHRLPDMKIVSIKYLGGGSSSAFSLNDGFIIKFPKLGFAGQQYSDFVTTFHKESKLSAVLSPVVKPHEVINPIRQILPADDNFPGSIFLYHRFTGTELDKRRFTQAEKNKLARLLGDFLKKLHSIKINQAFAIGVSKVTSSDIKIEWGKQYDFYKRHTFSVLKNNERQWFTTLYEEFLKEADKINPKVVFIHGDFGPENVLVTKTLNKLQVIDFEDMALGDAVSDFCVWYQHFGADFVLRMLEHYGTVDKYFMFRVKFYSARLPLIYFDLYRKSGNKKFLIFARKFLKIVQRLN